MAESKKLALLRILDILRNESDASHPLKQAELVEKLAQNYGIELERKAVGYNLSLLREAGYGIESDRSGSYFDDREFDDTELHLLMDSVLGSQYISPEYTDSLIRRLRAMASPSFRDYTRYVRPAGSWNKTNNPSLFLTIESVDEAIGQGCKLAYRYNKYGPDRKLYPTSEQRVSPYRLLLRNRQYYLMAYSDRHTHLVFHRLDRITDITVLEHERAYPLNAVPGFENGIDERRLFTGLPYMYSDTPEPIRFLADIAILDQVFDWFGTDITVKKADSETQVEVRITASPNAMEHWATQYINHVEILSPAPLRDRIRTALEQGLAKYADS